ncbi:MAG: proline--tRNA ligase [Alphaproteobacteria bacterium]|nr:proline--tRNA ligase [Alphaproteobacteria bacterium]
MRLSRYLMPTLKENPVEAQIVSHRLMLRAGMIRQAAAGIYTWLPLGYRVLRKIEQIVREEQDRAGAQELLMPTLQNADLWKQSGRYDAYGPEMLRIKDRHDRELVYGPTAEEVINDIARTEIKSYKETPKILYNIQWKFRDEVRPRFGVMRGREFLMKDAYSFDLTYEAAKHSYNKMFVAYLRTFARCGVHAIPMKASTGPIGGDLSHEFIVLAETGEEQVYCHKDYLTMEIPSENVDYDSDLEPIYQKWTSLYAATEEKFDETEAKKVGDNLLSARGIEVGQVFYYGKKYSNTMNVSVMGEDGKPILIEGGCYGIGVSRLMGAIIEASHDDNGIIWPESVAPFKVGIINTTVGKEEADKASEDMYKKLQAAGVEVLFDDRDERAGVKFSTMDLIGLPYQIIVGVRGLAKGVVEIKNRKTGERKEVSPAEAINFFTK